jgi:cytosine/adenosine deaminase-related metal-dependent hydrolase
MVVHNPQSNMNNAVGRTDIFALLNQTILLGLGTDGMSASLYADMRAAHLIHKHDLQDNRAGWNEVRQMVLQNNAEIFQRLSGRGLGRIAPGLPADLILVDYFPPTPMSHSNIWGHILFGIADAPVDTVMINGKMVMRHKQFVNIDEAEATAKARELAKKVWAKI